MSKGTHAAVVAAVHCVLAPMASELRPTAHIRGQGCVQAGRRLPPPWADQEAAAEARDWYNAIVIRGADRVRTTLRHRSRAALQVSEQVLVLMSVCVSAGSG